MLSAKIKDEPVNQMVSCKSSFAFEEWNEELCCRDRESLGPRLQCVPQEPWDAGSGAVPEQQVGLCRISGGLSTAQQEEEHPAGITLEDAGI